MACDLNRWRCGWRATLRGLIANRVAVYGAKDTCQLLQRRQAGQASFRAGVWCWPHHLSHSSSLMPSLQQRPGPRGVLIDGAEAARARAASRYWASSSCSAVNQVHGEGRAH